MPIAGWEKRKRMGENTENWQPLWLFCATGWMTAMTTLLDYDEVPLIRVRREPRDSDDLISLSTLSLIADFASNCQHIRSRNNFRRQVGRLDRILYYRLPVTYSWAWLTSSFPLNSFLSKYPEIAQWSLWIDSLVFRLDHFKIHDIEHARPIWKKFPEFSDWKT
jgi:hypothetical protein